MNYTRGLETVAKGVRVFAGAHKYQCRLCECSRGHESASRGRKGANKGRESAYRDCRGAQRGWRVYNNLYNTLTAVLLNFLLQAKRVRVYCRGLESALEAVRVLIEALRCCRGRERLEEVPKNVN